MLLNYSTVIYGTKYQTEHKIIFIFDATVVTAHIEYLVERFEAAHSLDIWHIKYIDYVRKWLQNLKDVLTSGDVRDLAWSEVYVEPQRHADDLVPRRYAEDVITSLVRLGYGTCLCSRCNETYAVYDLEVREVVGGESGGEFVQCPRGHPVGIIFNIRMGVYGEHYPPSRIRVYKVGKDGSKPSVDECPYVDAWLFSD